MNNQEPRFANQLNIQWFPGGHMARKPLDGILVCKPGVLIVHFTTPKSEKGKKQSSTLPSISCSSMQPT